MALTRAELIAAGVEIPGSFSAESFIPTSSTVPTDGLYLADTNKVAIATNSGGRLFIDSSGNVGIGQVSPAASLEIQAPAESSGHDLIKLVNSADTAQLIVDTSANVINFKPGTGDAIAFWNQLTEAARFDSSGRLLVGASSAFDTGTNALIQASTGGHTRFNLERADASIADGDVLGEIRFWASDTTNASDYCAGVQAVADGAQLNNDRPTRLEFRTTASGTPAVTTRMTILSDGKVGIGKTSPTTTLHLRAGNPILTFEDGTTSDTTSISGDAGELTFAIGASPAMTIDSSGNVGIGTTTPGSVVDIRQTQTGGETQLRIYNTDNSDTLTQTASIGLSPDSRAAATAGIEAIKVNTDFSTNAGRDVALALNTTLNNAKNQAVYIDHAGNVGIGTTNPGETLTLRTASGPTSIRLAVGDANDFLIKNEGTNTLKISSPSTDFITVDSNGRLLVGASSSTIPSRLVVRGNTSADIGSGNIALIRGEAAADMSNNDDVGAIRFSDEGNIRSAQIASRVDGTPSASVLPGDLVFSTANSAGTLISRMTIGSAGEIGIGAAPQTANAIRIQTPIAGSTGGRGIQINSEYSSDCTGSSIVFGAYPSIEDATFTANQLSLFNASIQPVPAAATITTLVGFNANDNLGDEATNVYGFESNINTGTGNNYNFYASGTADNYFAGSVGIGTTSPDSILDLTDNGNPTITFNDSSDSRSCSINGDAGNLSLTSSTAGSRNIIFNTISGSESARIDSSGRLLVGTSTAVHTGTASVIQAVSTGGGYIICARNDTGIVGGNALGGMRFFGNDPDGTYDECARIECAAESSHSATSLATRLGFWTTAFGSTSPTERMRIASDGNVSIGTTADNYRLWVVGGIDTSIIFRVDGEDTTSEYFSVGIDNNSAIISAGAAGSESTNLIFRTASAGTEAERMSITNEGFICADSTTRTNKADATSSTGGFKFYASSASNTVRCEGFTYNTSERFHISFTNGNGVVGSISTNGSATAFNTSSDYRLKENITAVTDGITRLQQLKPSRFNFIADPDKTVDGFIAHEAAAVVPEAVTGEKDAVDENGNPEYQGIDQSKLVPLLTAALQEAIGEIESLKARVVALESA